MNEQPDDTAMITAEIRRQMNLRAADELAEKVSYFCKYFLGGLKNEKDARRDLAIALRGAADRLEK